jgi:hypothetical protein
VYETTLSPKLGSDSRTPLFPDGLAVRYGRGSPAHKSATIQRRFYSPGEAGFRQQGGTPFWRFYSGGTPEEKRRRIKKRQDSESRQRGWAEDFASIDNLEQWLVWISIIELDRILQTN